jgi:hypothetical protein
MTKTSAMKRGRIVFYDDVAGKQPPHPTCVTYHIFHRSENAILEPSGWWAVLAHDEVRKTTVRGPFATERRAERVARELAACRDCKFLP